jgi:quercetin dioxygenase-like cupin family protein
MSAADKKADAAENSSVKIVKIAAARKQLRKINDEIRYANCFEEEQFTSGIVVFTPTKNAAAKQITHADKDVVCHVLEGSGRLRVSDRRIRLHPGTVCHIPRGTPHDFAAAKSGQLVLFCSLIKT